MEGAAASLQSPSGKTIAEHLAGLDEATKKDKTCDRECKKFFPYFNRKKHTECGSKHECELCGLCLSTKYNLIKHNKKKRCAPYERPDIDSTAYGRKFITCKSCQHEYIPHQNHKHRCYATNVCDRCGRDFNDIFSYNLHISKGDVCLKYLNVPLTLPSCESAAAYMEGLDEATKKAKTCDGECKRFFPYFNPKKHTECGSKHECELCGTIFSNKRSLKEHTKKKRCAPYERPDIDSTAYGRKFITCKSCQHEYIPHQNHKHRCYATNVCDRCGRDFDLLYLYNLHISKGDACLKYLNVPLTLPSCESAAAYKGGLVENDKKAKTCAKKCKRFFPNFNRKKHRKCGSKHECELCGSIFSNKRSLKEHTKKKSCTPHELPDIDSTAYGRKFITCKSCQHEYIPLKKHKHRCYATNVCDRCGRDFNDNFSYNLHISKGDACLKYVNVPLTLPSGQTISEYMEGLDEATKKTKTCAKKCKRFFPYFNRKLHTECGSKHECELCGLCYSKRTRLNRHKKHNRCTPTDPNSSIKLPSGQTISEFMAGLDEATKKDKTCDRECKKFFPYFNCKKHTECGSKYECKLCGSPFDDAVIRWNHLRKNICSKRFHCQNCGTDFVTIKERESHRDACEEKDTTCPKCLKSFTNFKPMLHVCHAKFMCKLCGQRFRYPTQLRRHKLRKGCSSKVPCRYCDRVFPSVRSSRSHQITCQSKPPIKVLTCRKCKRQYHSDVDHKCRHKITCEDCGRMFPTHLERYKHIMLDACKSTKKCNGCGQSFESASGLSWHLRRCGLWNQNSGAKLEGWRTKIADNNDKVSKCPVCWEAFPDLDLLERHMEKGKCSEKDRPFDKLVCIKCNQKKIKQQMHFCKGFHCRVCEKVFTSKSELTCHRTLQSCLAIQKCDHCDKLFKSGGFEEHVLLNLCEKENKKPTKPSQPETPAITPPGFCSFCFKRLREGAAVEHLQICKEMPKEEHPSCPFCHCKFSSPLDVFMHTANLKDSTCSRRGFPCGDCMFITTSKKVAIAHAKSKHNLSITFTDVKIETGFSCFVCNEHFGEKEIVARFHTLTCSETYGMYPLRVKLKRCNEEAVECEMPAKRARIEAVVKQEPETEEEYVPRLVLVIP